MSQDQHTLNVHPYTNFLVRCLATIYADVSEGPTQVREALRDLYWLTCFLDAKGQATLEKKKKYMEDVLDGKSAIDVCGFRSLLKDVMVELHREGYFIMAKYNPLTNKDFEDLEGAEPEGPES